MSYMKLNDSRRYVQQRLIEITIIGIYQLFISCSLFEVGKLPQQLRRGVQCFPYRVWPLIPDYEAEFVKEPGHIRSSDEAKTHLPSYISSIKRIGKDSLDTVHDGALLQCALYPNAISNSFIWFSIYDRYFYSYSSYIFFLIIACKIHMFLRSVSNTSITFLVSLNLWNLTLNEQGDNSWIRNGWWICLYSEPQ